MGVMEDELWLDEEAQAALRRIRGAEAAKKRATVILLAAAAASDTAWARVFEDERACNQRIWYQKWKRVPEIIEALEICTAKALEFADLETARVEQDALQKRRRAIAKGSVDAVEGLRKTALNDDDRADYRTEASRVLLTLADPELGARLEKGKASVPVEVTDAPPMVQIVMPDNGRDDRGLKTEDG